MSKNALIYLVVLFAATVAGQQREAISAPRLIDAGVARDASVASTLAPHTYVSMSVSAAGAPMQIGPGDLLEISVFDAQEFNCKVRVSSNGEVNLPLVGNVAVSGLATDEAQHMIAQKLISGDLVKNPQVNVFVLEYANQTVYVVGEVSRPGAYPLMGLHKLLDFVSAAGGLTPHAGSTVLLTSRDASKPPRTILLATTGEEVDPDISPGDTIQVTPAGIVYVLGDVARPGGFMLNRNEALTVMQVLALAEGTKGSASLRNARLIRGSSVGNRHELTLDLKKMFNAQSPDLTVQDGDILFVPGNATRSAAKRGIEAIVQTATGVAVYRR